MKYVESKKEYYIIRLRVGGFIIIYRCWKQKDIVEIKVTDGFAKANGYKSVSDMVKRTLGKDVFELYGGVPEWVRLNPFDGSFIWVPKGCVR